MQKARPKTGFLFYATTFGWARGNDRPHRRSSSFTNHHATTHHMGQIALEGMEFFAFHGYYDEEQKIGNKYGVDLYIQTDLLAAGESDKLQQTVNYEVLYRLVAEEMRAPARLLEHVAHRVLDRIMAELPHVRKVKVNVSKFNPPLGGICHRARVTLLRRRKLA